MVVAQKGRGARYVAHAFKHRAHIDTGAKAEKRIAELAKVFERRAPRPTLGV